MDNQYKSLVEWQKIFPESSIRYFESGLEDELKKPCWKIKKSYSPSPDPDKFFGSDELLSTISNTFLLYSGFNQVFDATELKAYYREGSLKNEDVRSDISRFTVEYMIYSHYRSMLGDLTHVAQREVFIGNKIDEVYSKIKIYEFRIDKSKISKNSNAYIEWVEESMSIGSWAEWPESDDPNTPGQGI